MARGVRLNAWTTLAAVLAAGALLSEFLPSDGVDWQPGLAASQPWRAWTAAFVHWSPLHLGANLLGTLLVALLGQRAGCTRADALTWALAWPLAHLALLAQPALQHYGGLSGVLHAGVAVAALRLVADPGRARAVGALLLAGLLSKLLLEAPWGPPLRHLPGWDIPVAPLAHASGALAGAAGALVLMTMRRCARRA